MTNNDNIIDLDTYRHRQPATSTNQQPTAFEIGQIVDSVYGAGRIVRIEPDAITLDIMTKETVISGEDLRSVRPIGNWIVRLEEEATR